MGLIDKFKNLFTEEIEEEEKPIKEVIQVEIPSPANREEYKENFSENEFIRKEEKAKGPVYFDDKDFDTLEKPKEKINSVKDIYINSKPGKKDDKPVFQLSPIISPVYGVLDKNYHKEDITSKKIASLDDIYHAGKVMSIDDVRKKAFGTLEDDVETGLFGKNSILFNEETEVVPKEKDIFDELDFNLDGVMDSPKEEAPLPKPEIKLDYVMATNFKEEVVAPKTRVEKNMIEDELTKLVEENDLGQDDLFNLIDSMYEKREEE